MPDTNGPSIQLTATRCAICGTEGNSTVVYPATFDASDFTVAIFSARRTPDRIHYRLVSCLTCGLLRSDPVASDDVLSDLYARSEFHYGDEIESLASTYGRYLAECERFWSRKDALLEIGCGNGFFLEEARRRGYISARGVEPSTDAVGQAPPELQKDIVVDIMRPGLFEDESFDVICFFQVLDHLPDPGGVLAECFKLLRPGGVVLCLNHDAGALSARLLKEKSPIVDIEHTYLYSRQTLARLLQAQGYNVVGAGAVRNTYSVRYLNHLLPLPRPAKNALAGALHATRVEDLRLSVKLGNQYAIAQRPRPGQG